MKITFVKSTGKLYPIYADSKHGSVIFAPSVDDILEAMLKLHDHESGIISYSLLKSDKPCIGIRNAEYGRWEVVYSNTTAATVGDIIRICDKGFKLHVGRIRANIFTTHYFTVETHDRTTD